MTTFTVGYFKKITEELADSAKVVSRDSNFELRGSITERRLNVGAIREIIKETPEETLMSKVDFDYELNEIFKKSCSVKVWKMSEVIEPFVDAFDYTRYSKEIFVMGGEGGEEVVYLFND